MVVRFPLFIQESRDFTRHFYGGVARHFQFEQEAALHRVADAAFKFAERAKIGSQAVADPADDGYFDNHAERRYPRGAAGESPEPALRIVPTMQGVISVNGDRDGALFEEPFNRHEHASRKNALPTELSRHSHRELAPRLVPMRGNLAMKS